MSALVKPFVELARSVGTGWKSLSKDVDKPTKNFAFIVLTMLFAFVVILFSLVTSLILYLRFAP